MGRRKKKIWLQTTVFPKVSFIVTLVAATYNVYSLACAEVDIIEFLGHLTLLCLSLTFLEASHSLAYIIWHNHTREILQCSCQQTPFHSYMLLLQFPNITFWFQATQLGYTYVVRWHCMPNRQSMFMWHA